MKKPSSLFDGGTKEMQKKRLNTFYVICATAVLIAAMLVILVFVGIAAMVGKKPGNEESGNVYGEDGVLKGYVSTSFSADQIYSGDLLLIDGSHTYKGSAKLILVDSKERPKTAAGSNAYTISGRYTFQGTEAAVDALHAMIGDFYAESGDDNIILANAYDSSKAETQEDLFKLGTVFSLEHYVNYDEDPQNKQSISGFEKYEWIYNNAHKYGFILVGERATDAAQDGQAAAGSNTFRYVGVAHSTYIESKNLSFEAYINLLKTKAYDSPLTQKAGGDSYVIYYIASGSPAYVSSKYEYTVSGDNASGYIITENRSAKIAQGADSTEN